MRMDERSASDPRPLSPEEVGARVSAILEAAERDARAVIDAAHHEAAERERAPLTLEGLASEVDELRARVAALERVIAAADGSVAPPRPPDRRAARAAIDPAARVRAIELALAGHPREAIAQALASSMAPGDIERLLDEVLAG
jgi:hypothetical protein